jgi:hypothetical protein
MRTGRTESVRSEVCMRGDLGVAEHFEAEQVALAANQRLPAEQVALPER